MSRVLFVFSASLMFYFAVGQVRAALLDDFRTQCPKALTKLQNAYSHSRAYGVHIVTDANGKLLWRKSFEIAWREKAIRDLDTMLESNESRLPAGSVFAFGGTAEKYFGMHRLEGVQGFTVDQFGPQADFLVNARLNLAPLAAAYCRMTTSVPDMLADTAIHWQSARIDVVDKQKVIKIEYLKHLPERRTEEGYICFEPNTWAVVSYRFTFRHDDTSAEQTDRNLTGEGRVKYSEMQPVPKVSQVKSWRVRPGDRVEDEVTDDVTKLEFVELPEDQFTLKAFGIEEPNKPIIFGK